MVRRKNVIRGKRVYYSFFCRGYSAHFESNLCGRKYVREDALMDALSQVISIDVQKTADIAVLTEQMSAKSAGRAESLASELKQLNGELARAEITKKRAMEDYLNGKLPLSDFERLKGFCREEIDRLRAQICALQTEHRKQAEMLAQDNPWLKTFRGLNTGEKLTSELAHAFIQRINIYDCDRIEVILRYRDEREELIAAVKKEAAV